MFGEKDPTKVKKHVTLNRFQSIVFIVIFGLFVLGATYLIMAIFGLEEQQTMKIECINGSSELVEFNKTIYCGDSYTILEDKITERTYKEIESIIKYNGSLE